MKEIRFSPENLNNTFLERIYFSSIEKAQGFRSQSSTSLERLLQNNKNKHTENYLDVTTQSIASNKAKKRRVFG